MGYNLNPPDDRQPSAAEYIYLKHRVWLPNVHRRIVQYLVENGFATLGEMTDYVWPDEDSFADFEGRLHVNIHHLRRRLGKIMDLRSLTFWGHRLIRLSDLPISTPEPDDPLVKLMLAVYTKYDIILTPIEARILKAFCDARTLRWSAMDRILWPEADGAGSEVHVKGRHARVLHLRRKFGDMIDIESLRGCGYALHRLGPKDNPMHERK